MYYLYILQCRDGTLYTGITTDVGRRYDEHRRKVGARYTRSRGVRRLLYIEEAGTKGQALRREVEVKRLRRAAKMELIERTKSPA